MCDFGEGLVHAIKHMFLFFFFLQEVSASHEEQSSP